MKYAIDKPIDQISGNILTLLIGAGVQVDHYNELVQLYLLEVVVQKDNEHRKHQPDSQLDYVPVMLILLQFSDRPKKMLDRCFNKACNLRMKTLLENVRSQEQHRRSF